MKTPPNYKKLSDAVIEKLSFSPEKYTYYIDTEEPGLRLKVGARDKTFQFRRRVGNKIAFETLGKFSGEFRVTAARNEVLKYRAAISEGGGKEFHKQREETHLAEMTLKEAVEKHLADHSTTISPTTAKKHYRDVFNLYFPDLLERPIATITLPIMKDKVIALRSEKSRETSLHQALRHLAAVFSYFEITPNPAKEIIGKKQRLIKRPAARTRALSPEELRMFYKFLSGSIETSLNKYDSYKEPIVVPSYLLFLLFTGCRKHEARVLKWKDMEIIPDVGIIASLYETKTEPRQLPIPTVLYPVLDRLKDMNSPYVFPGRGGNAYMKDYKNTLTPWLKMVTPENITRFDRRPFAEPFSAHDLRRTFETYGYHAGALSKTVGALGGRSKVEDSTNHFKNMEALVGHSQGGKTFDTHYYAPGTDMKFLAETMEIISQAILAVCTNVT